MSSGSCDTEIHKPEHKYSLAAWIRSPYKLEAIKSVVTSERSGIDLFV